MLERIDITVIEGIAKAAGDAIMQIYQKDFTVEYKDDKSPLTEADTLSNKIICDALLEQFPEIPMLSEENKTVEYADRKDWNDYWCIDPIDGTKEFIKKNDEFTVNIALVRNGVPVLGVVYAPAIDDMYTAKEGEGAFKNGEKLPRVTNDSPEKHLNVVASKSHLSDETQAFIDALASSSGEIEQVSKGSSLKLCMVAEGEADIYPRLAPTMEWDTAAAQAVVLESGKAVYEYDASLAPKVYLTKASLNLKPLEYNKQNLLNPWFVVA